jgi:N-acetyl-alpha-D-muramate 1-phosphate uridylyltransferase
MKAMILAAGLGTRLGQLTHETPKCLLEAGGKTMLEHVILKLKQAGVRSLIINLFHLGDKIEEYLASRKNFGIEIEFSREKALLGTGGGLQKVEPFFQGEGDFILYNSDIYTDLDLRLLVEFHSAQKPLASLVTMQRPDQSYLLFCGSQLVGWETPRAKTVLDRLPGVPAQLAFCGIQVLSSSIFKYMRDQAAPFSTIKVFLEAARAGQRILSFSPKLYWADMGTPEALEGLRKKLH